MVKIQGKVLGLELSRWGRISVRVLFKKLQIYQSLNSSPTV